VEVIDRLAHFVVEDPGQLLVQVYGAGIVRNALVAQELHAVIDPVPAFLRREGGDGDVPGHVPGVELPDGGEAWLKLADPRGQLHGVEVPALILVFLGPDERDVRDQAAEGAEGLDREGVLRWRAGQDVLAAEGVEFLAAFVQPGQEAGRPVQRKTAQQQGHQLQAPGFAHAQTVTSAISRLRKISQPGRNKSAAPYPSVCASPLARSDAGM
jgi:hypothetical protein